MRVEAARAELRVRNGGEAIDLGALLLRALGRPALRAFAGVVLPLVLLFGGAAALVDEVFVMLTLWWLKPLFDRVWVLLLGQGLFGDAPGVRELWGALWKRGRKGLLRDLTLRRLRAASRPMLIAITLLEGADAREAEARRHALASSHRGATWTAFAGCVVVEHAVLAGLLAFEWLLLPTEAFWTPGTVFGIETDTFFLRSLTIAYVLAMGFTEALFVACGFGLYIDGRTRVEGWDVELVFRRMARRLSQLAAPLALVCLAICGLGAPRVARAQLPEANEETPEVGELEPDAGGQVEQAWDAEDAGSELASTSSLDPEWRRPMPELAPSAGEAEAALERVWAQPELSSRKMERTWTLKEFGGDDESESPTEPPEWLSTFAGVFAEGLRALLWVAMIAVAASFLYLLSTRLSVPRRQATGDDAEQQALVQVAGAAAQRVSAAEALRRARELAAEDRHVEALAALYVGMLAGLSVRHALEVPRGATEAQCANLVREVQAGDEATRLFDDLVKDRLWVTYGRASFSGTQLLTLMTRYAQLFGVQA